MFLNDLLLGYIYSISVCLVKHLREIEVGRLNYNNFCFCKKLNEIFVLIFLQVYGDTEPFISRFETDFLPLTNCLSLDLLLYKSFPWDHDNDR